MGSILLLNNPIFNYLNKLCQLKYKENNFLFFPKVNSVKNFGISFKTSLVVLYYFSNQKYVFIEWPILFFIPSFVFGSVAQCEIWIEYADYVTVILNEIVLN